MQLDLSGKTALVTGSTQGIGFAIAAGLAAAGARVAVNGRTPDRTEKAAAELRARGTDVVAVAADLATDSGFDAAYAQLPSVDILVDNLGVYETKPALEIDDTEWRRYFEVNVLSAIRLTRAYLPSMTEREEQDMQRLNLAVTIFQRQRLTAHDRFLCLICVPI